MRYLWLILTVVCSCVYSHPPDGSDAGPIEADAGTPSITVWCWLSDSTDECYVTREECERGRPAQATACLPQSRP